MQSRRQDKKDHLQWLRNKREERRNMGEIKGERGKEENRRNNVAATKEEVGGERMKTRKTKETKKITHTNSWLLFLLIFQI